MRARHRRVAAGVIAGLVLGCAAPTRHGERVDPEGYARAEAVCRDQAVARYGAPPPGGARDDAPCDPQSWLCHKTRAWMLDEGNPLSTATPRDRLVQRHTDRCLAEQGFDATGRSSPRR